MSAEEAMQSFNYVHMYIHHPLFRPETHFFQAVTEYPVGRAAQTVLSVIVGL